MASTLQSPGIRIIERDASLITPGASTTIGATVGVFRWGPTAQPILIDNEGSLVSIFGKPDDQTAGSFFSASSFLSYTQSLWVTRAATVNKNATSSGSGLLIGNLDEWDASFSNFEAAVLPTTPGPFSARYPGVMGNGLIVSVADSGTFSTWEYAAQFPGVPGTSEYAAGKGGSNDEMHIIVVDGAGQFSGTPGTVLEKYEYVSKARDAINFQGMTNYWVNVLRNAGSYVYGLMNPTGMTNWGSLAAGTTFATLVDGVGNGYDFKYTLTGGTDDNVATDAELQLAWDLYANVDMFDISLFFVGNASRVLSKYVIDNIGEVRKDAVVFVSLVDETGGPVFGTNLNKNTLATSFKTAMGNSSYAVIDSGFKYMYDKYNDKYRWIALNSDVAGLCAKVDASQDTWFSPAGYTKGQIRGVVKLAWQPSQSDRDYLYKLSINSVVTFTGQGTILYGDKTATLKPSAFDRINVRRLFLVLEKSIGASAKFQLFEQNDEITRELFKSSVEPFLRDVQGRRGIQDFRVICDATENTPQVVAANEFRGKILIRPMYSINFIQLTFTAVGPSVSFETASGV